MALIVCNECNKAVSTKAKTCPHCGNPIALSIIKKLKARGWLLFVATVFLVIMPILYLANLYGFYVNINNFSAVYKNGWQFVFPIILIVKLLIVIYGMYAGACLLELKDKAIYHSKHYLQLKLGFSVLEIFFLIAPNDQFFNASILPMLGSLSTSVVYFLIFWLYFTKSKNIKNIFNIT